MRMCMYVCMRARASFIHCARRESRKEDLIKLKQLAEICMQKDAEVKRVQVSAQWRVCVCARACVCVCV